MAESEDKFKKLKDFLASHPVASLATVSKERTPHSSTIYFISNEHFDFYFLTTDDTIKHKQIGENKRVALNITDEEKIMTVQVEGNAQSVQDREEKSKIINQLKLIHYGNRKIENPPISKLFGEFILYKITPSWLRWLDFKDWNNTVILEVSDFDDLDKDE